VTPRSFSQLEEDLSRGFRRRDGEVEHQIANPVARVGIAGGAGVVGFEVTDELRLVGGAAAATPQDVAIGDPAAPRVVGLEGGTVLGHGPDLPLLRGPSGRVVL